MHRAVDDELKSLAIICLVMEKRIGVINAGSDISVLILGDAACGKSSLLDAYIAGRFPADGTVRYMRTPTQNIDTRQSQCPPPRACEIFIISRILASYAIAGAACPRPRTPDARGKRGRCASAP